MKNERRIVNPKCVDCSMCSEVTKDFLGGSIPESERYYQCLAIMEGECVESVMLTPKLLTLQQTAAKLHANDTNSIWSEVASFEELRNGLVEALTGYEQSEETYKFYVSILMDIPGPGGFKEIQQLGWYIEQTGGNCMVAQKQFGDVFICVTDESIAVLNKSLMDDDGIDEENVIYSMHIDMHQTLKGIPNITHQVKQEILKVYRLFCKEYGWEPVI